MERVKDRIRFLRVREYAMLVIRGDLEKEKAAKYLGIPLEEFESWLRTWQFIDDCLMEEKEQK